MTFDRDSTTDDVLASVDLTGLRILVTGASAGLGQETARALAAHGADLVLGVRDPAKGEAAAEPIRAAAAGSGGSVELREVDLASLASVRAFTDAVRADHDRIDVIIANAGVMAPPSSRTDDGFELQFGTNHLGHFVLVNRLRPILAPDGGRVVVLTSAGHRLAAVDLDDPNFEHTDYDPWVAYGRAKSANSLFAVELDRRGRAAGQRAVAVHPGIVPTELGRHLTRDALSSLVASRGDRPTHIKSIPAGAATTVWAAVVAAPDEVGGRYCEDCAVAEVTEDRSSITGVFPHAVDPAAAAALWARSEELVGETFPA